ncbi:response regulator transcription factor [Macrococcus sp. DPC7161]|uniref:response regulator transcription factor n=1 Tax=Macrococcus sp. DPC7161 TaxID=2507060 RepID=UPI00100C26E7|nr:response regulator transcription factor [Macrococcus sp. DPC7161]RXK17328.1 response regulator transcription factor [Macrococcus sp. DPC7161]
MKLILVDDHHIVRQGMKFLLSTQPQYEVVEDFSNGQQLIDYLKTTQDYPEVIVMDLVMPEMNGIETTAYIKTHYPDIKVLILSSFVDEVHVLGVLHAGADGFEIKDSEPDVLIETINRVYNGEKVFHPHVMKVKNQAGTLPHLENPLSKREIEVLREMSNGYTNKEIAEVLFVSEKTIKTHVSHIFTKLQVTDRTQASLYAVKYQLI